MGQTLVQNYLHIIFSTKDRVPLIYPPFDQQLYQYLAGTCNSVGSKAIEVGGYQNHVHILCMLSKTISLSRLLEQLKANSSKWMKTKDAALKNFYWQEGYGAFSVDPKEVDIVKQYIFNQQENHKNRSFQQEYREFLEKYHVDYDERYVWD